MGTSASDFLVEDWGVQVHIAPVAPSLAEPSRDEGFMQMAPGEFLAIINGLGRMHVTAGTVTLDPDPGRSLCDMDYLAYGWAPRWIRILREEFSLHASAVLAGDRAVALMGFSGAGKSTTTTALTKRGLDLIIDDVLPVDFVNDIPMVSGWMRPVHLTDEAAKNLGVASSIRIGPTDESKIAAELPFVEGSWPLSLAIELCPDDATSVVTATRLTEARKLQALLNHSNSAGFASGDGRAQVFFAWATRLAQSLDVYRITRPTKGWSLDEVLSHVHSIIES